MPMLGRHERVLAIDGQYIHLMPSTNKARAVFENARTMSYHIRSVIAVQQSTKASATFKLIVQRNGGAKRYEFEAESPRLAGEIMFRRCSRLRLIVEQLRSYQQLKV
jgi:target of rapamycin complex 2 subunit MAPKAP1